MEARVGASSPGATPAGPPESFFRLNRGAIIGALVGAIVVLAGVGLLLSRSGPETPARGDPRGDPTLPEPAPAEPGVLQPSPVAGSGDPTPAPTDTAPPAGETIVLGDGVATVSVPPEWQSELNAEATILVLDDGQGDFMFVRVYNPGPGADALEGVVTFADETLTEDHGYSNIGRDPEPRVYGVGGAVVSGGALDYEALWSGGQGAASVQGAFAVLVRGDGAGLALVIETPSGQFNAREDRWSPILDSAYSSFRDG